MTHRLELGNTYFVWKKQMASVIRLNTLDFCMHLKNKQTNKQVHKKKKFNSIPSHIQIIWNLFYPEATLSSKLCFGKCVHLVPSAYVLIEYLDLSYVSELQSLKMSEWEGPLYSNNRPMLHFIDEVN